MTMTLYLTIPDRIPDHIPQLHQLTPISPMTQPYDLLQMPVTVARPMVV